MTAGTPLAGQETVGLINNEEEPVVMNRSQQVVQQDQSVISSIKQSASGGLGNHQKKLKLAEFSLL